jgi:hypothetical protein
MTSSSIQNAFVFFRQYYHAGWVDFHHIPGLHNPADALTKGFDSLEEFLGKRRLCAWSDSSVFILSAPSNQIPILVASGALAPLSACPLQLPVHRYIHHRVSTEIQSDCTLLVRVKLKPRNRIRIPCATMSMLTYYRTSRSLHFPFGALCSLSGAQPEIWSVSWKPPVHRTAFRLFVASLQSTSIQSDDFQSSLSVQLELSVQSARSSAGLFSVAACPSFQSVARRS